MLRNNKIFLGILCCLYFIIIIWLLFFFNGEHNRLVHFSERHFSLIPFRSTIDYIYQIQIYPRSIKYKIDLIRDIGGNLLLLFPWGIFGPALFLKLKAMPNFFASVFIISLIAEMVQFIFNIGVLDIDDIIYNTLGGLGGFIVFKNIKSLFPRS